MKTILEHIVIRLQSNIGMTNVVIVYRPPSISFHDFYEQLEKLLFEARNLGGNLLVLGDFNLDILSHSCQSNILSYKNLLASFDLRLQNSLPTRETATTSTCIDHCFANILCKVDTVKCHISDHHGLLSDLPIQRATRDGPKYMLTRDLRYLKKDENICKLLFYANHELSKISVSYSDVEKYLQQFSAVLIKAFDKFCSLVKRTPNSKQNWNNRVIKRLIAQKNVLKNKQIKENSEEISRQLKFVKNRLNNEIRKYKRSFYDTKLAKCSSAGGMFKVFNERIT